MILDIYDFSCITGSGLFTESIASRLSSGLRDFAIRGLGYQPRDVTILSGNQIGVWLNRPKTPLQAREGSGWTLLSAPMLGAASLEIKKHLSGSLLEKKLPGWDPELRLTFNNGLCTSVIAGNHPLVANASVVYSRETSTQWLVYLFHFWKAVNAPAARSCVEKLKKYGYCGHQTISGVAADILARC